MNIETLFFGSNVFNKEYIFWALYKLEAISKYLCPSSLKAVAVKREIPTKSLTTKCPLLDKKGGIALLDLMRSNRFVYVPP